MLTGGTRNTNSPRELHAVCSFLIFTEDGCSGGSGVSVTIALGSAKPGSRKTVPDTSAYDSGSAFFLPACAWGRIAISNNKRLMPVLFFLFLLFLVFVLIIIEVVFFFLVVFFIFRGFELKRIETSHGEI